VELRYYQTSTGEQPFVEWLKQQRDINRAKEYFEDYKARTAQKKPRGRR